MTGRERGLTIVDGVLFHADAEICVWVNAGLGVGCVPKLAYGFGVLADGWDESSLTTDSIPTMLAAGAYFFDFYDAKEDGISDVSCAVYIKDPKAIRPSVVRKILDYPFNQLGVRRLSAQVPASNRSAIDQAQRLGFVVEGTKKYMAPDGGDVLMLGLYPENCPYLRDDAANSEAAIH